MEGSLTGTNYMLERRDKISVFAGESSDLPSRPINDNSPVWSPKMWLLAALLAVSSKYTVLRTVHGFFFLMQIGMAWKLPKKQRRHVRSSRIGLDRWLNHESSIIERARIFALCERRPRNHKEGGIHFFLHRMCCFMEHQRGGDALHVLAPILVFYFYKPCISSIIEGCQTKSKMISWNCGALLPEIYNEDTISGVYWTGPLKQVKCNKNSLCHKWGRRMAYLQKNSWGIIVAQNYHNLLPCNCSQTLNSWKFGILVNENPIGAT